MVRLGHRHSINQSNRLQLTTIFFLYSFLSCRPIAYIHSGCLCAYIHSGYFYSAPSRNLFRRNLRHLNWSRRLGSLAITCDPSTIAESSPRCYTSEQDFIRSDQLNSLLLVLNLGPTLAPLIFSLNTQQPCLFQIFATLQVLPTLLSHLYCVLCFTKLMIILSYIQAVWGKIDSVIWPYH